MRVMPERSMEAILQVCGGALTATEAANRLQISRKSYYQREKRALSGMLAALQPRPAGRPSRSMPTPLSLLQDELDRTKKELEVERLRRHIRETLARADTRSKKKRGGSVGRAKDRTVA